jgi:ferrous iron transport protein A
VSQKLDSGQGIGIPDAATCVHEIAKKVWSERGPTLRIVDVMMNWSKAVDSGRQEEGRCDVCPLNLVKAGVAVRIKRLCASPETQNRLREIGLCEDQIIKLLTSHSNFICQVCNARLAISEQLARLILVEPLQPALVRVS